MPTFSQAELDQALVESCSHSQAAPAVYGLLLLGADPDATSMASYRWPKISALTCAARKSAQSVDLLLEAGADPCLLAPLSLGGACTPHIRQRLLDCGADVNAQDEGGMTALMYVAKIHPQTREMIISIVDLLKKGADASLKNHQGISAADLCKSPAPKALILEKERVDRAAAEIAAFMEPEAPSRPSRPRL